MKCSCILENRRGTKCIYGQKSDLLRWLAAVIAEIGHHKAVDKEREGVAVLGDVACKNAGGLVDRLGFVCLMILETICAVLVAQTFNGEAIRHRSRDIIYRIQVTRDDVRGWQHSEGSRFNRQVRE